MDARTKRIIWDDINRYKKRRDLLTFHIGLCIIAGNDQKAKDLQDQAEGLDDSILGAKLMLGNLDKW